jgi:hypothetical protein
MTIFILKHHPRHVEHFYEGFLWAKYASVFISINREIVRAYANISSDPLNTFADADSFKHNIKYTYIEFKF